MEQIPSSIEHYGYLVAFFGMMLESTGAPLPGETILLASGFLARFFAGLRVLGALVAGTRRMRWRAFVFSNTPSGAVWATAAVLVGYFAGSSLGRATLVLAAVLAVAAGFYLAYRWAMKNRAWLVARGEAVLSYPPVERLGERYERQLAWLLRRLTPGQYLGLHLTLGFVFAAGCLWLFGDLAEDVLANDPLARYDQAVAAYLHSAAAPPLTAFFLAATALGSIETVALAGGIVAVVLTLRRSWLLLGTWLAAVGGSVALTWLLKELFARPRPSFENPLLVESSYAFPSGHAMVSMVVYGMLAYFAVLAFGAWRARTAVVFGTALLVVIIGLSRLYLGVHYPSDVLAGYAAGGVWLSALITGAETLRRRKQRSRSLWKSP